MIRTYFTIGALLLLSACGNNTSEIKVQDGSVSSAISAGSKTDKELQESIAKIAEDDYLKRKNERKNITTLSFDKLNHDFGDVISQKENRTEFVVTNTGDNPLVISKVSASCGCTMPQKREKPILPGQTDIIAVVFKSKPSQKNEIKKTITVTANTAEKIHKLEIRAFVK